MKPKCYLKTISVCRGVFTSLRHATNNENVFQRSPTPKGWATHRGGEALSAVGRRRSYLRRRNYHDPQN